MIGTGICDPHPPEVLFFLTFEMTGTILMAAITLKSDYVEVCHILSGGDPYELDFRAYRTSIIAPRNHRTLMVCESNTQPAYFHSRAGRVTICRDREHYINNPRISIWSLFVMNDGLYKAKVQKRGEYVHLINIFQTHKTVPLCRIEPRAYKRHFRPLVAELNGITYMPNYDDIWGEQTRESREICTIVDFTSSADDVNSERNAEVSPGNGCLYGVYMRSILMIDPRSPAPPTPVYTDLSTWFGQSCDTDNGLLIDCDQDYHMVNIFDGRANAMIGTGTFLRNYEHLISLHN